VFFFILARFDLLVLQFFDLLNFAALLQAGKTVTDAANNAHDAKTANLFPDIFIIFYSLDSDAKYTNYFITSKMTI